MTSFLKKIKNGFIISGFSLKTIWGDKRYLFFPFITTIAWTALASFTIHLGTKFPNIEGKYFWQKDFFKATTTGEDIFFALSLLMILFLCELYVVFVSSTIAHYTLQRFQTGSSNLKTAFFHSISRLWTFIKWSILAAAVGTITIILRQKQKNKSSNNLISSILTDLAGLAWGIATFFMPVVLAFEDLGTFESIKRSAYLMKNTFGESTTANFSLGFITMLVLILIPVPLFFLSAISLKYFFIPIELIPSTLAGTAAGTFILFFLPIFVITFTINVMSTASTIFKTAVYAYATGKPTGIFPKGLIETSFENKRN